MENTKIEWATHSFNPWWGCQRVSPGCEHCYAETLAHRYNYRVWGPAKTTSRRMMSDNYWKQPLRWNKAAAAAGQRARVFCASMADVFEDHPEVEAARARLFEVIEQTPHLDWLLLTKRPQNLESMLPWTSEHAGHYRSRYWPNVWIGTSVEDQRRADERIPILLQIPARVRFLSCEPLLGPVDISRLLVATPCWHCGNLDGEAGRCFCGVYLKPEIHWVIAGGESGPGARPMHPDWARSLRDQCEAAGVSFFFKQWGEYGPVKQSELKNLSDRVYANAKPAGDTQVYKLGKHASGRLLDGRTWDEVPQ